MTHAEFFVEKADRLCQECSGVGMVTELNPNNNGLLVRCPHCGSKRPWGSLLYLKQNERRRPARPPLPNGATLDSIWARYGDRCIICSAPKSELVKLGIGRHVHHVAPYAMDGHKGPLVPICTHCHALANQRQRMYWFIRNLVLKDDPAENIIDEVDGDGRIVVPSL